MSPGVSETNNNQYIKLLCESLPNEIEVVNFTFLKAILARYQILHVHWPDRLFRAESKPKTYIKRALLLLLITRIFIFRTPTIWTVHDKFPHEKMSLFESFLNSAFIKILTSRIYLQMDSDYNLQRDFVIKHGNYQSEVAQINRKPRLDTKSVVCVGFLRPSKNIENLINNFPSLDKYQLAISGQPITSEYGHHLLLLSNERPDIALNLQRLTAEALAFTYENCLCSIIPYINIYNSGAALYSLSIPRPVIATNSETMSNLQEEVGEQWIQLIPQHFQSEDIVAALNNLSQTSNLRNCISPLSNEREWSRIGIQHLNAYSKILNREISL
jgi:beta-1,4-mannosyltransferase